MKIQFLKKMVLLLKSQRWKVRYKIWNDPKLLFKRKCLIKTWYRLVFELLYRVMIWVLKVGAGYVVLFMCGVGGCTPIFQRFISLIRGLKLNHSKLKNCLKRIFPKISQIPYFSWKIPPPPAQSNSLKFCG